MKRPASALTGLLTGVILLAIVLVILLPGSPAVMPGTMRDSGVFLYTGWRILDGEIPYRDVWDHKPPAIYYLNALGLALAGGSRWGVWFIEVVFLWAAAWLGWRLLWRANGGLEASFASLLWLTSLVTLLQGGNLTSEYTLLLQFACFWSAWQAEKAGRYGWRAGLIGLLTGLAFLFRQNAIGAGLAIALFRAAQLRNPDGRRSALADLGWMAAGALSVTGLALGYLAAQGALADFWNAAILYNLTYSSEPLYRHFSAMLKGLGAIGPTGLALLAVMGWLVSLERVIYRKTETIAPLRALLWIAILNLPVELLLTGISGFEYRHYFMTLLPVSAILAAQAFQTLLAYFRSSPGPRWVPVGVTVALAGAVIGIQAVDYYQLVQIFRYPAQQNIAAYIQANSSPQDSVLLWGAEAGINFLSHRRSPTRYVYQYPLRMPGYTTPQMVEEFLLELQHGQPRLIIDTTGKGIQNNTFGLVSPEIDAGLDWLAAHYVVRETIEGWPVYEYSP